MGPRSIAENLLAVEQDYLCEVTPMSGMCLKWTISGDTIYMQQSLDTGVAETWHGLGFADVEPFNMGLSDFIVSFFGGNNYTGVRDLYKYDAGNNYPCWDVLTQCSADGGSAGRMDLADGTTERRDGLSVSSWSRKLVTGDFKDSEITAESKRVMFAYGKDDYFTYHGKLQQSSCNVNFFTMETDCGGNVDPAAGVWVCSVCSHQYDPAADGDGKAFEDLPEDWVCPVCAQPKSAYQKAADEALEALV